MYDIFFGKMHKCVISELDVFEISSKETLRLESNRQIQIKTPLLMINNMSFEEYVKNIIYGDDVCEIEEGNTYLEDCCNKRNLTEISESKHSITINNVFCTSVNSEGSFVKDNQAHGLIISAKDEIQLSNNDNPINIEVNDISLADYIYNIVNINKTKATLPPNKTKITNDHQYTKQKGIRFYGKTINTNNLKSTKHFNIENGEKVESVLNVESNKSINFCLKGYDCCEIGNRIKVGENCSLIDFIYETAITPISEIYVSSMERTRNIRISWMKDGTSQPSETRVYYSESDVTADQIRNNEIDFTSVNMSDLHPLLVELPKYDTNYYIYMTKVFRNYYSISNHVSIHTSNA